VYIEVYFASMRMRVCERRILLRLACLKASIATM
jgi:hypothetical protein